MGLLKLLLILLSCIYLVIAVAALAPPLQGFFVSSFHPKAKIGQTTSGAAFSNFLQTLGSAALGLAIINLCSLFWGSDIRFQVGIANFVVGAFASVCDGLAQEKAPLPQLSVTLAVGIGLILNKMEPGVLEKDRKKRKGRRK